MKCVRDSDSLSGYDTTTIAPIYVEEIREEILGGMTTGIVYRPSVIDQIVSDYGEAVAGAVESSHLTLWVAEELPCGLAIFDDRVALGAYDDETGMLRCSSRATTRRSASGPWIASTPIETRPSRSTSGSKTRWYRLVGRGGERVGGRAGGRRPSPCELRGALLRAPRPGTV